MAMLVVKVVPGASRDAIAGRLGDALKIRVAAAPERGKANQAVIQLLADALGLKPAQITVLSGHTQPRKTLQISGLDQAQLDAKLSRFQ